MNLLTEIDFRYDWVSATLNGLESAFSRIQEEASANPGFDGLWQLEYSETVFGIAFVLAQTYITGTVANINELHEHRGEKPIDKLDCYSDSLWYLPDETSPIILINSIANYFKHHEEWDKWPANNQTVKSLHRFGIGENIEFPCHVAASKLWNENEIFNLHNLLTIISEWRKHVLLKYK